MLVGSMFLAMPSCNTDMYDEDEYIKLIEREQTVDSVDVAHTWTLFTDHVVAIDATALHVGARQVQIWLGNAAAGEGTTLLAQADISDGEQRQVAFAAPSMETAFYAAIVGDDGCYTVAPFTADNLKADFSAPLVRQATVGTELIGYQTCTCCFEDAFPAAGDYDYNDLVLRFSYDRTAPNQITLYVTLAAVGTDRQMAAAVRLVDYRYDDIQSVAIAEGRTFNDGYPDEWVYMIDSSDLLLQGKDNEAVLNLFEDAHWSIAGDQRNNFGVLNRRYYNVSKTTSADYQLVSPYTLSYVITFKDSKLPDAFTLNRIDPFAIVDYNSACYEVHAAYKYRATQVLQFNTYSTKAHLLPWALMIPTSAFRYPLEGMRLGYFKDGALFGAYMTAGHAFGEWAANRAKALDWYNYPTSNQVF